MKKILVVVLVTLTFACNREKAKDANVDTMAVERDAAVVKSIPNDSTYERFRDFRNYLVTGNVAVEDIQEVNSVCAVVVSPTDEQIKSMIEENGEEDFSTIADDASFYQSEGTLTLDSFGIKTIEAEKRYIRFVGESETWVLDIRQKGAPEWSIIFFDPKKAPQVNSWVDITFDELIAYYGLK
ncbi:hypothetical protein [Pseudochryseolinea flava]|uniref:Lipoprotein n=1 Tax=Pseudochryseolinea flava TaxID=2059302 RepID=A0A364XYR5_9BACT|nr:hypothetical protein [Pseudochryseolinea flava]RAV99423.1 hypothetical protein DQQ10_19580 [Pseudochryseolinea flava]